VLAGDDADEIVQWIRRVVADDAVEVSVVAPARRPNMSPPDTELYKALSATLHRRLPEVVVAPRILTGFTDNWVFREAGLQAYGFSPIVVGDDDAQRVHGNDERISLENVREGTRLYTDLLLQTAT
jgi:acetylornithine deacetylase/succinyl-diaminopimelate desuccinylase-like protein